MHILSLRKFSVSQNYKFQLFVCSRYQILLNSGLTKMKRRHLNMKESVLRHCLSSKENKYTYLVFDVIPCLAFNFLHSVCDKEMIPTRSKRNDTDASASSNRGQDNSDWMKNLPSIICDTRHITDISIPGSHDSITYSLNKQEI